MIRLAAFICHLTMWGVTPILAADVVQSISPNSVDAITISLPIYISSIVATASFTYWLVQLDRSRVHRLDQLQDDVADLRQTVERLARVISDEWTRKKNRDC